MLMFWRPAVYLRLQERFSPTSTVSTDHMILMSTMIRICTSTLTVQGRMKNPGDLDLSKTRDVV